MKKFVKTFREFINESVDYSEFINILRPDREEDRDMHLLNHSYTYDDWKNMVYELLKLSFYDHDVFGRDGKGGIKNIEWFARCVDYLFEVYCKVEGWDMDDDDESCYFMGTTSRNRDPQPSDDYECELSGDLPDGVHCCINAYRIGGTFTFEQRDGKNVSVTGYNNVIR